MNIFSFFSCASGHKRLGISATAQGYQQAFLCVGAAQAVSQIYDIGTLTPVYIQADEAEYYFEQPINGQILLFPVEFVKENGVWKILEF